MMENKNINKGQSTLEYAVIIVVVAAALLAMQIYMKRGVQGKMRESTDSIGEQFDAVDTESSFTSQSSGTTVQEIAGGVTNVYSGSGGGSAAVTDEHGNETVDAW